MIELETEEIAEEMVRYYKEHKATLCGTSVSISMSCTMKTIEVLDADFQCRIFYNMLYDCYIKSVQ